MNGQFKRIFTLFVAFLLFFCGFHNIEILADASSGGSCGQNLSWSFDSSIGKLTISGSGDMTSYNSYYATDESHTSFTGAGNPPWYDFASSVKYLDINSGVTSIGNYAFRGCSSIKSLKLPKGLEAIGTSAFSGCSSLESVYFPKSLIKVDDYAFYGCNNLKDVYMESSEYKSEIGIYPSGNDSLFNAKWHYNSSGIPGYSIPSGGSNYNDDPDAVSVGYNSNLVFDFDVSSLNLPSSFSLVLCEGEKTDNVIAKGDSKILKHTVKNVKSDRRFLFTVLDENGKQITEYNNTVLEYDIKIHVTTGFFDMLIAFLLGIFGMAPEYRCTINY